VDEEEWEYTAEDPEDYPTEFYGLPIGTYKVAYLGNNQFEIVAHKVIDQEGYLF